MANLYKPLTKEQRDKSIQYYCDLLGIRHFMYHTHEDVKEQLIQAYWDIYNKAQEDLTK